ncbi:MAG TPA: GYD domain-containing protein [Actinomycetota bacterium]
MATYVHLVNFTDQGIKNFRESAKRADAFAELVQKNGGTLKDIYWTLGEYDIVVITEAPDSETATAVLLQLAALGNVRTATMEAFDREAFDRILAKTG